MYDIIKAIILGIVEGLTEFLPISSTGHLILLNQFITFDEKFTKMFDIVIQLGAILSVVGYFRKKLFPFGNNKSEFEKREIWSLWTKTILGVIPAILIGALLHDVIEERLFNPYTVSIALVLGGILLIIIERRKKKSAITSVNSLTCKTAFFIGIIQCFGMIPGTSRSAATIIGAMLLGASRVVAAEFSFFLAIPTMFAASGYSILKTGLNMTPMEFVVLLVGFIVSFLVAWIVIAVFMNYISKKDFKPFAYYRIVLGIFVLVFFNLLKF